MNFFLITAFLAASAAAHNATLAEVYGEAPEVSSMTPWSQKSRTRQARSERFFSSRTPEECDFDLEIVIVQDATASFQDNYAEMKNTQLPLLVQAMESAHPDTKFGIVSFRDKPVWSLGDPNTQDWCTRFETPLDTDASKLTAVYDSLISTGGADPQENQFGTLLATAQSNTPGWSNPDATRLIVLATDAPPHFKDDGHQLPSYGMTDFTGVFDEANMDTQCVTQYYPTPGQVRDAIMAREAYVAFLIFDGEWWNELPTKSWEWFNSYIGQTADFVEPLGNTSTTFFQSLAEIIKTIEDLECNPQTTMAPPATTTPPVVATTTPPVVATTTPPVEPTPAPTCPPCPTPPCHCHCHHRHCSEVVIKLAHRPRRFRLEVEN